MLKRLLKMAAETVALLILKRRLATVLAAIAIVFGSLLSWNVASAGPNLVVNGNFELFLTPQYNSAWKRTLYKLSRVNQLNYLYDTSVIGGASIYISMYCLTYCPAGEGNILSQQINSLTPGNKYELSFYASGMDYITEPTARPTVLNLTFGSQALTPINLLPVSLSDYAIVNIGFRKETQTFTYIGAATSAILSFIQNFTVIAGQGCNPCSELFLANVKLEDLGPAALPPTLTLQKALGTGGRANNADQFKVSILNAATSAILGSGSTTGTGGTVTGGLASITGDTATRYKVVEEMLPGSVSNLAQYSAALSCTNAYSAGTQFPAGSVSLGQNFPLLVAGDQVSCTVTNTPKAPTVRLTKALGAGGRANNADQFTVLIQQRLTTVASGTSTGTGGVISAGSTGWTNLVAGTSYNLSEVMVSGSASNLAAYTGVVSCSNALSGSTTVVAAAPGAAFTPTYGDALDCTLTNTPKPATLTVTQKALVIAPATFNPPETFSYTGNNGWTLQKNSSTVLNTVTTGATQTLTALKVATTLTVAVPTAETGWKIASIRCTDTNAAVSGNPLPPTILVSSTNNTVVIPANVVSAAAALQCAVIGSRQL